MHHLCHIVARSPFVNNSKRSVVAFLCNRPCAGNPADIRRNDHHIIQLSFLNKVNQNVRAVNMVNWNVKEPARLSRVHIHNNHAVCARLCDHVCNKLRGKGLIAVYEAILSGISVVRDYSRNLSGVSPSAGVDHEQKFHKVVVHRVARRGHQKNITTTDRLGDSYVILPVRKLLLCDGVGTVVLAEIPRDLICKLSHPGPSKNPELS
mmetsp:Transcript_13096/g.40335  ORF Transcript_13096/g.40335 Transcript_13096/m.40335 type:complete len:207 (-) Transcript_13096:377-997(-)